MISLVNFRKLFKSDITFVAGAATIQLLPNFNLPQIAFVGKSNVGKSSLINMVCGRKALARVSHTPGRTQQINFFDVGGYLSLVDLPGYGYAKVSHNTREKWEKLITYYLFNKRPTLVNLLIDSRRGLKDNDIEVADMIIENGLNLQIVFTKKDQIKNSEILQSNTCAFFKTRYNIDINVLFTSVRNRDGASELQNSFYTYIGASQEN